MWIAESTTAQVVTSAATAEAGVVKAATAAPTAASSSVGDDKGEVAGLAVWLLVVVILSILVAVCCCCWLCLPYVLGGEGPGAPKEQDPREGTVFDNPIYTPGQDEGDFDAGYIGVGAN